MKKLKKITSRAICVLLTMAMLCADSGVTVYAAAGLGQEILEETVEETLAGETQAEEDMQAKELSADDGQIEDSTTGEMQAEDGKTEESSKDNERAEEDLAEQGETGEPIPEEVPVKENSDENTGREDAETGISEENPMMEDEMVEENPEDVKNTGDASAEESMLENDIEEDAEKNLETATKTSGDNIASGEYKENGNNITWVINADGKLTVEGTGDYADLEYGYYRSPWSDNSESIISAEIKVTGMTDASTMFYGCRNLISVDLSNFDTSQVTSMSNMFAVCQSLTSLNLSNFNTSNVTSMSCMFDACTSLTSLDLSSFDTTRVVSMSHMFANCQKLTNLDISSFDTSQVTGMNCTFNGCNKLVSLDISKFDTSQAEYMEYMFNGCSSLTKLDVSGFETSQVKTMECMFRGCSGLTSLDVSNFDTSQVTNMSEMFSGCNGLNILDMSNFDIDNVTNTDNILKDCSKLIILHTPYNLKLSVELPSGTWYQADGTQITELPQNLDHSILIKKDEVPIFSVLKATKIKTNYVCGDTINIDDLSIVYYDADSLAQELEESEYTTNVDEIDMSIAGKKTLIITYDDGENIFTDEIELTVTSENIIASGEYKENGNNITWVIDANGKLLVEGTGDFSDADGWTRAPWYNYRNSIKYAEVNVTGMTNASYMFNGCGLRSINLEKFDTNKVTDMSYMFVNFYCQTNLDVSGFDTSEVTDMSSMFSGCRGLTSLDVSGFDTSKVTDMSDMFFFCESLISLDVSGFDTSKVTNMSDMFLQCSNLTSLNVSGFDTSKVTNMAGMFGSCSSLTSLDVSGFDTSKVVNMAGMFSQCDSLISLDVSGFNTSKVTDMSNMFSVCMNLTSLDMSSFDTSEVTDMSFMFCDCWSLASLDVSGFDTSKVTDMRHMFQSSNFTSLDVSSFDTSKVTNMSAMFNACSLTSLDVSNFDTSEVIDMSYMFAACSDLTSLDVTGFDTSNVICEKDDETYTYIYGMDCMFSGCSSLTSLDISSFNTSKLTTVSGLLKYCKSLTTIRTPYNLKCKVSLSVSEDTNDIWYDESGNEYTKLPQNLDHSILIRRNKIPVFSKIEARKVKTDYGFGDTIHIDDLTVLYYDNNGMARGLESNEYTTNVEEIDVSTQGEKTLIITYRNGGKVLTDEIKLTVKKFILNADNVKITLSDTSGYVYDRTPKTPEVTVVYTISGNSVSGNSVSGNSVSGNSVSFRSVILEKGRDYEVTYENNINAFETGEDAGMVENAPRVIITGQNRYGGIVSRDFPIQKAAAPKGEEQAVLIQDFNSTQEERMLDLSGCFEGYGSKSGYSVGIPVEDDTVAGTVLSGRVSVDEKGILTFGTNAGKAGDFAVIPIGVSFANYKDAVLNVKIIFENTSVAVPVANPESERQLVAGSKVTLTCETLGAGIYYTTGDSEKTLADPTEKSTRYTEPITINKDMYIKAIAIKGSSQSKAVTLHYTVVDAADKVLKPYAAPGQGAVEKGTKIELKSNTPDAVIYYVTGGNADMLGAVPVDESHKYTEPIEITRDMVIKAIAKKDGMKDSDVSTFKYKIKVRFDSPVADPASGTVDRGSYISLKAGSNADIYYTMDLSSPITSESAKFYENKIRVDGDPGSSMVIKAVAEKNGIYSEIVTFTYTVSENTVKGLQVMLAGSEEFTYTGSAITPAVIVTNNGEELTEGEDYTVRYSNNVKAADKNAGKAPKITVTGKGNLTKSRSVTFSIAPKDIGDEEEVVGGNIVVVQDKTASPVLFYGGVKLTAKDFVNPNAKKKYSQDETITVTGKGNFEGTRDIDVKVVNKEDLKKFTVAIDNGALKEEPLIYDGEAKTLDGYFEVFDTADKSAPLEEYSDYAVIYPKNNINAGKVKFTVIGLGEYYGTVTKTYTIKPRVVKTDADGNMEVNVNDGDNYPFRNGGVIIPDLAVTCDGNALIPGKDYKVTYSNNKKICTGNKAKCTISFTGNYKGSKALVRKFDITPAVLDDVDQINGSVSVAVGDMVYTGKPGAYKSIPYVTANGVLLKSADYKVSYYKDQDRKQVIDGKTASSSVNLADGDKQTVYVKIEGRGNYEGTLTAQYNIYRLAEGIIDLAKAKVNFVGGNKSEYTGEGAQPEIEVMYKLGKDWRKVDVNDIGSYVTVTYINNVNKGKATVMINGNGGKYVGSKTAVFSIVPKSMK